MQISYAKKKAKPSCPDTLTEPTIKYTLATFSEMLEWYLQVTLLETTIMYLYLLATFSEIPTLQVF